MVFAGVYYTARVLVHIFFDDEFIYKIVIIVI